ncbi:MAG: hypothetical protein J6Y58_07495 [Clostridiales bacterium]|nr:hypothetical protein [Clostridiales bacterium]
MKKVRRIRIICIILLAIILIVSSLFVLLPRRNDGSKGCAAVLFAHEDIMFPEMDYRQLFSQLDITSYFVIDDSFTEEQMNAKIDRVLASAKINSVVLICEGDYADKGFSLVTKNASITDLILISPVIDITELGAIGTGEPAAKVAIFSEQNRTVDTLYERLSGEDTKFTSGMRSESQAPELFLSSDARRYYARRGDWSDHQIASLMTMNNPVMQTYLANYIKNHVLQEEGVSRAPLLTWVMKTFSTVLALIAFFLYAATLPANRRFVPVKKNTEEASDEQTDQPPVKKEQERGRDGKIRGRSIAEKYRSSLNHLLAMEIFLGCLMSVPAMYFVSKKQRSFQTILLLWICISLLSSAFFLLPFIRKIKNRKVRSNRSMWGIHMAFTILLGSVIFMLTLFWKGTGFLKPDMMLLLAMLLSIMTGVSMIMLQLCDNFFGRIQGTRQSVIDSIKFSAIRFVPMVIVFIFSLIINRGLFAFRIFILMASLAGASYLRRVIKRGAFGEVMSVVLYSCLYWMMF